VRHVYYCPLRRADTDSLPYVNTPAYVDYLQEARVDMLSMHAPQVGGQALAEGVVVVRHEIEFVSPLMYRDKPVCIETWVSDIRPSSFTLSYEILDQVDEQRHVYTRASTLLAPFVIADERPRRLRPEERTILERFLES
jgi:acyl-CoA thioester hydrolase